ncbi:Protein Star [Orchesella cincta]|uniref:Protein Star n=1 Tax=Orchesella cincta TaxID=48709 RepID=A0A1D2MBL5_ORCCI|nr:Protein Star [Orchesella cincta]
MFYLIKSRIMLAAKRYKNRLLSLDVEGAELDILKTIDFKALHFESLGGSSSHDVEGKNL